MQAPAGLERRGRRRGRPRRWAIELAVAAPAALGIVAGIAVDLTVRGVGLYAVASPGQLVAGLGVLTSAIAAGAVGAIWVTQRAGRHAATMAAARALEERRRFLLRLDHELKNPLTAIRAGLANIEAAAPRTEAVRSVQAQTVRVAGLLADLRKLADLETQPLERTLVDVSELLEEVMAAIDDIPDAAQRRRRLTVPTAPWPLPPVWGDRDLLFLVLYNLVANAVKFSAPGDSVEVRASEPAAGEVAVEVADTGIGIPADELGQVWDELARGRAARGLPGTGIGLALVRAVVARHGGDLELRSRAGEGTVVVVRLPAAAPGARPPTRA